MEPSKRTLPENAYRPLKEGESYQPVVPSSRKMPEVTRYSLIWGLIYAAVFSMAAAYRASRSARCSRQPSPSPFQRSSASAFPHHRDTLLENVVINPSAPPQGGGGRRHLYHSGHLYSQTGDPLLSDLSRLAIRRLSRHSLYDPVPQIFRPGNARTVSLSRGHSHYRSAGRRRVGRQSGQSADQSHDRRRSV